MPTKPRFKACVLAVALTMLPWCAEAAGLGRLNVLSGLGQPFKGEIELVAVQPQEAETLKVALASAEAHASAQMAYPVPSLGIRFSLNKRESGQYVVSVSSVQAIDEPVFNLLVELSWAGGQVKREYTALIDPVGYSGVPGGATISPVAPPPAARMAPVAAPSAQVSGAIQPPSKAVRPARKGKVAPVAASGVASQPAAKALEAGESYTVKSGDTLSRIAGQVKPDGVSLEQVLVGLYQANPDAFHGNMNRLKRGKILRIPSSDDLGKQDQAQAVKEVKVHSANWQNYRRQLAESAAKGPATSTEAPQGGGRITAKVEDKGAQQVDKTKDVLKLSRGASKTDSQQARIRALEEEASARKKALDEANQRVAELQKNVQEMEKSVALKSQQGAELQKKAEQAKASVPASAPAVVAPIASAPAAASAVASKPVAASVVASAVQPQPAPKPKRVAPPPPPPEPTFMDMLADNALTIGGGLLAVVLGIGGLIWARNRRRPSVFENSLITSGDLKPNTVLGRTGGGVISTQAENSFLTDFSRQGLGSIDTDEVDPIAEADVYMAYGRDAQAEEILKDALVKDPQRQEVRMKLLDIYAARKDKVSFQEVAAEVFAATGGQGQYWEQASYLGRNLDPENPLYAGKNSGTGAALAVGAVGVAAAAAVAAVALSSTEEAQAAPAGEPEMEPLEAIGEMQPLEPEEAPASLDFEFELPEPEQPLEPEASAAAVLDLSESAVDELGSMDFTVESEKTAELPEPESAEEAFGLELDLGEGLELPAAPEETLQPAAEEKGSDLMELDLPIDLGVAEMPEFAPAFTETETKAAPVAELDLPEEVAPSAEPELAMPEFEMPDLDLSLDLGEEGQPVEEESAMEAAAIASFSEELSMEEPLIAEMPIPGKEAVEEALSQEESIDLDFGFTAPEPVAAPAPVAEEPIDISLEIGESGETDKLDFVPDDPVQTKIELARAYIDMGDVEGAREILQEAEQEGNPTQQELARNLLAAL